MAQYPPPQAGFIQPGYPMSNLPQPGYPQPQPGYPQPQPGYPQPQPGYPQPQPGYPQPQAGYPQPGYSQPGYPQPGVPLTDPQAMGYPPPQMYPQPGQGGYSQPTSLLNQFGPTGGRPVSPGPDNWMPVPANVPLCPPGLEYLTMIDQLLVHQKVELLEVLTGFETRNKFTVKNSVGQKIYKAAEHADCLTRNCCGPLRPFDMKIIDNYDNEVIHLRRPLACDSCCFPCCLQSIEVCAPPGNIIGTVEQEWSILTPQFIIKDHNGDTVLRINGPFCTLSICNNDVEFKVLSKDGQHEVGKISKQWAGLLREAFTDADHFGITFPMDLDVRMKAVMLGACFLIDVMFFEKTRNQGRSGPSML